MRNNLSRSPIRNSDANRSAIRTPEKSPRLVNDKVQVIIRIRPLLRDQEQEPLVGVQDDNTLAIVRPGYNNMYMKFNHIVSGEASQQSIFNLMTDSVNSFLKGVNNTIFAYGQTGAGKTYTITGDCPENVNSADTSTIKDALRNEFTRGILPRALEMIFSEIKRRKEPDPHVWISFYEIYNEKIYDLYMPSNTSLDVRESKSGEISIPDLSTVEVKTIDEAFDFLAHGVKNRITRSTSHNSKSSRSHSIFQLVYQRIGRMKIQDKITEFNVSSTIRIVDLAGSEKFKIPVGLSPAEQQLRIQEVTCINGSLSSLGHCISALIQKSRTHIPFRNSKLTRILSDSLSGNGKLKLIVCISPSIQSSAETFSTLQFANRAKRAIVERTPKVSQEKKKNVDIEEYNNLKQEFEREKKMRIQLEMLLKSSDKSEILQRNAKLQKQNEQLKAQLKILTNSQLRSTHAPPTPRKISSSNVRPKMVLQKKNTHVTKPHGLSQYDGKSFLSLSILKEDRRKTEPVEPQPKPKQTSQMKKKMFQNKFQKFLDIRSPEKKPSLTPKKTGVNDTIKNQLENIRKAIGSKYRWGDMDNSDQQSDKEYFGGQTDDEELFKMQMRDGTDDPKQSSELISRNSLG